METDYQKYHDTHIKHNAKIFYYITKNIKGETIDNVLIINTNRHTLNSNGLKKAILMRQFRTKSFKIIHLSFELPPCYPLTLLYWPVIFNGDLARQSNNQKTNR